MKKRITVNATRFESVSVSGETMWKDRGQTQFVLELDENLVDPASGTDYLIFTEMLKNKNTSLEKFLYDGYQIEPAQLPELGSQQEFLDIKDSILSDPA
jgi:hypothetical protein